MISKALKTINSYKMLENTENIIVGLSGGADSVSLTHFLYTISKKMNFNLHAVHINHGIRNEEAKRDEIFVKDFCKELKINLIIKEVDIPRISKELKIGMEEAGRKIRYEVFNQVANQNKNSKIATAHTLSDNVETILMRLSRGTGLKGLCGIPPVRENIIRPLIEIKREEIEEYCHRNNLSYVNDSSNFEKDYTRNKIRLDIIPKFKEINPNFENAINRAITSIREDENYLENFANKIQSSSSPNEIVSLPCAIKNRVLMKIINKHSENGSTEQKHIKDLEKIIKNKQGKMCISGGKIISYSKGNLNVEENSNHEYPKWQYPVKNLNILPEIGAKITLDIISIEEYNKLENKKNIYALDFEKVPPGSVFRNRRPGDKFTFKERKITKSIKKIFNEVKIPPEDRENIPILANENTVVWTHKIGVSKNFIPNSETKKVAIIKLEKIKI